MLERLWSWLWQQLGWRWVCWFEDEDPRLAPLLKEGWRYRPERWKTPAHRYQRDEYTRDRLLEVFFAHPYDARMTLDWVLRPERLFIWFEASGSNVAILPTAWRRREELRKEPPPGRSPALPWEIAHADAETLDRTYFKNALGAEQAWANYERSVEQSREELRDRLAHANRRLKHAEKRAATVELSEHREHWEAERERLKVEHEAIRTKLDQLGG